MTTVTLGEEALGVGRYGQWVEPKPLGGESGLYWTQVEEDEYLGALVTYEGRAIITCDNPLVLGLITGIIVRDKFNVSGDPEDVACEIMGFIIPEVLDICSNVHVVGWDVPNGGFKLTGIW